MPEEPKQTEPALAEVDRAELLEDVWRHVLDMESTARSARENGEYNESEYLIASSRRLRRRMGWPILGVPKGFEGVTLF